MMATITKALTNDTYLEAVKELKVLISKLNKLSKRGKIRFEDELRASRLKQEIDEILVNINGYVACLMEEI